MDEALVEILLRVKEDGVAKFAEASALATNLREAIQSLNRQTAEGVPVNEAARRALNELSRGLLESGISADIQKNQIQDARQALTRYIEVVAAGMAPQDAYVAVLAVQTEAMRRATDATNDNTRATEINKAVKGGGGGLFGIGSPLGAALSGIGPAQIIGGAAVVFAPFIESLSAALVMMTSFLVSGAAMVTLLGSISLGFMGLGGALVLLADKTGMINGAINRFKEDFTTMADHLGRVAAPAATEILKFIDGLMPLAEREGASIIEWFQARLPNALSSMGVAIKNLTPDLNSFGRFLGQVFDQVSPQIAPMFEDLSRLGISAFQGLISNLVSLSGWFEQRLPTYGPIMRQIFGGIGDGVQFLATNFGKLSDWFAQHWPGIQKQADDFKTTFGNVFNSLHVVQGLPMPDGSGFWHGLAVVLAIVSAALVDVIQFLDVVVVQSTSALPAALENIAIGIANWKPPAWLAWLFAWDSGGSIRFPGAMQMPGPANFASAAHQRPGITGAHGGGGSGNGHRITINVTGAQSPQATAQAIVRKLVVS